jgi:hypothetical protein
MCSNDRLPGKNCYQAVQVEPSRPKDQGHDGTVTAPLDFERWRLGVAYSLYEHTRYPLNTPTGYAIDPMTGKVDERRIHHSNPRPDSFSGRFRLRNHPTYTVDYTRLNVLEGMALSDHPLALWGSKIDAALHHKLVARAKSHAGWDLEYWVTNLLRDVQSHCVALVQAVLYAGLLKAGPVGQDHLELLMDLTVTQGQQGASGRMQCDTTIEGPLRPYLRILQVCTCSSCRQHSDTLYQATNGKLSKIDQNLLEKLERGEGSSTDRVIIGKAETKPVLYNKSKEYFEMLRDKHEGWHNGQLKSLRNCSTASFNKEQQTSAERLMYQVSLDSSSVGALLNGKVGRQLFTTGRQQIPDLFGY